MVCVRAEEVRIQRLMASRGYSLERCQAMLECQPEDEVFCGMASYIIDNGGAWEDAVRQLEWVSRPCCEYLRRHCGRP